MKGISLKIIKNYYHTVVSGEITTLVVLDYEAVSSYYLRVRATDMGRPTQLFSKFTVTIPVVCSSVCLVSHH